MHLDPAMSKELVEVMPRGQQATWFCALAGNEFFLVAG
jgi:hypothetical protein